MNNVTKELEIVLDQYIDAEIAMQKAVEERNFVCDGDKEEDDWCEADNKMSAFFKDHDPLCQLINYRCAVRGLPEILDDKFFWNVETETEEV